MPIVSLATYNLIASVDAIEGTDMTVNFMAFVVLDNSATLDTTITIGIEHDSGDTAGMYHILQPHFHSQHTNYQ